MFLIPTLLLACGESDPKPAPTTAAPPPSTAPVQAPPAAPPAPASGSINGGPYPTILLTQAWFTKTPDGKPQPMPARLEIWRKAPSGWERSRLEDPDSNVFHKALPVEDGIITIGAEKAMVKKWTLKDGQWSSTLLWERNWGGKFQRIRDLEIGDVDGDAKPELVIATHDSGVVAVIEPELADGKGVGVTELDQLADTFVHEIEIGDLEGDGKLEFFATPSERNKANASQPGLVVMYRHQDGKYVRTVLEDEPGTHAKEILAADLDRDGKSEFFSVFEAEVENKQVKRPVLIRQYKPKAGGGFEKVDVMSIEDRQTRFLLHGDLDGDGFEELVAAAMKSGLWLISSPDKGKTWTKSLIDDKSGGFEHASLLHDLDGDGQLELYVASDDQREFRVYTYDRGAKTWSKQVIGPLDESTITWNVTATQL